MLWEYLKHNTSFHQLLIMILIFLALILYIRLKNSRFKRENERKDHLDVRTELNRKIARIMELEKDIVSANGYIHKLEMRSKNQRIDIKNKNIKLSKLNKAQKAIMYITTKYPEIEKQLSSYLAKNKTA